MIDYQDDRTGRNLSAGHQVAQGMEGRDWFRRKTWTGTDQKEFFERLARSRQARHKARYLRIQALHLVETGDHHLIHDALQLLNLVVTDYPEPYFLAVVQHQRAVCLRVLGHMDEALDAFRAAFAQQRVGRCVMPGESHLDFADFVLSTYRTDLFREALSVLGEFGQFELMPRQRYRSAVSRAFLYHHQGEPEKARFFARTALKASAERKPVFHYSRDSGVVKTFDTEVQQKLWQLIASTEKKEL